LSGGRVGSPGAVPSPAWSSAAACKGRADLYFAPHAERPPARVRREAEARWLCGRCPVRDHCRDHARAHQEFGLWGGETEGERADAGYPTAVSARRRSISAPITAQSRSGWS
jgi:WhiB family redox-sensing transcriptional regulator